MGTWGIEVKALAQGRTAGSDGEEGIRAGGFWLQSWHIYSTRPAHITGEAHTVISSFLWSILSGSVVTESTYHNAYWEHQTSMKQLLCACSVLKAEDYSILIFTHVVPSCPPVRHSPTPQFQDCISSIHLSEETHGISFINLNYLVHNVAPPQQIYTHLWERHHQFWGGLNSSFLHPSTPPLSSQAFSRSY